MDTLGAFAVQFNPVDSTTDASAAHLYRLASTALAIA